MPDEINYKQKYEMLIEYLCAEQDMAARAINIYKEPYWPSTINDYKEVIWFRNDVYDAAFQQGRLSVLTQVNQRVKELIQK